MRLDDCARCLTAYEILAIRFRIFGVDALAVCPNCAEVGKFVDDIANRHKPEVAKHRWRSPRVPTVSASAGLRHSECELPFDLRQTD
jgi:hypothetical protein